MDALYRLGRASATDIHAAIPSPPSSTAVRTLLTILEDKGHITHQSEGPRYIYEPVVPRDQMAKTVIGSVMDTFFEGSIERVVATLVDSKESQISDDELARLQAIIEEARRQGR